MAGYPHRSKTRTLFVIVVIGTAIALVYGFTHRDDAHPATVPTEPVTVPTPPCPPPVQSEEGAARAAVDGLHQLALANIGQADIDQTVDRYVDPNSPTLADPRQAERDYLHATQGLLTDITTHVLGWQTTAYTSERATIRFATSEDASGGAQYINDVVVVWNGLTDSWRLILPASIEANPDALSLLSAPRGFCDG